MSLALTAAQFQVDLLRLWEVTRPDSYAATCDLIESFWLNARVVGHELAVSPIFTPKITYGPMATLSVPGGTAASGAAAIEASVLAMCAGSIFTMIPPSVATPPPFPVPGGKATPGLLTAALMALFVAGAGGASTGSAVAAEISAYLLGWQLNVAIPPAAALPLLII